MTLLIGYVIDLIIGDPFRFHPVIVIGKFISYLEQKLYKDSKVSGVLIYLVVIGVFIVPIYFVRTVLPTSLLNIFDIYIIYSMLATKSLYVETLKVVKALKENKLIQARKELSYLVSRDTTKLTKEEIYKAVVETISENTIDGILAPLFYIGVGLMFNIHIELLLLYKITNTFDSMIGYKNKRYQKFGYFSAKMDDLLNFIPSRLGSVIMIFSGSLFGNVKSGFKYFFKDRLNSTSPNAGHPESAIAGLFEIELLGPSTYFGTVIPKKKIGINKNLITEETVYKTYYVMFISSLVTVVLILCGYYAIY